MATKKLKARLVGIDKKNLLLLCTKNVHFTFGNNICQQKDSVAMGPLLIQH